MPQSPSLPIQEQYLRTEDFIPQWRVKSLFYELANGDHTYTIFTFKNKPIECHGVTLHSFHNLYMQYCVTDPTEVSFVDAVFDGNFIYFERIQNNSSVRTYLDQYRKEAAIRRKSIAFKTIVGEAASDSKGATAAAKYLIDEPWATKDARTTDGRKKRAEARETAAKAFEDASIQEDIKRLREEGILKQ